MTKHKQYSPELKTQIVLAVLKGQKSLAEICREHEVAADLVCRWRDVFLERASQVFVDPCVNGKGTSDDQRFGTDGRALNDGSGRRKKSIEAAALSCEQRQEIVAMLSAVYPVQSLCEVAGLSRSNQAQENAELEP